MPFVSPSYITENPTFLPTVAPTSLMPTIASTGTPTSLMPIISFTTDLTLSNVQTNYLDTVAQQSVVIATANSMNISVDFVSAFTASGLFFEFVSGLSVAAAGLFFGSVAAAGLFSSISVAFVSGAAGLSGAAGARMFVPPRIFFRVGLVGLLGLVALLVLRVLRVFLIIFIVMQWIDYRGIYIHYNLNMLLKMNA
jgi:hypothetical protein